jgi:DNA-binding protein Fis
MKARGLAADPARSSHTTERALTELLTHLVGQYPFQTVVAFVRDTLVRQALVAAQGNKTNAARLLGLTRQAIQQHAYKLPSLGSARGSVQHDPGAAIDHGGAGRDAQLGEDAPQVGAYGPLADMQSVGDLLVQQSVRYEAGNL